MIKSKHVVHHTFQFQQTAFFRADTQRILIWAPDKTRIDKMSNKLFIFSGGWYSKCTLLLSVLTHRQKCKNVINFNNCQGFCGHHSTITTRWLSQLSTFTYSRVYIVSCYQKKTRNMDLSLSEFLVFLFSKKPQFSKTFSICVHFCRLAPIYFGGWGGDKRIALFSDTKRALFLFVVISNFFGSDFFISVVQPLMKMAFQTVLFDL